MKTAVVMIIAGLLAGTTIAQAQSYNSNIPTFGDRVRNGEFAGHNYQQEQQPRPYQQDRAFPLVVPHDTSQGYSNPYRRNPY